MKRLIVIIFTLLPLSLLAQKNSKGNTLSLDLLKQATSIAYNEDNGSVPPEYQYQLTITVTRGCLHYLLHRSYQERIAYDEKIPISEEQYQQFLKNLANQGIKMVKQSDLPLVGGPDYEIWVKKNAEILFAKEYGYDLHVSKGKLRDAFIELLRANVKRDINKFQKTKKQEKKGI